MDINIISNSRLQQIENFLSVTTKITPDTAKRLSPKEISILSAILYIDIKNQKINTTKRDLYLFSTKVRKKLQDVTETKELHFNNIMSMLRKKGYITKERLLFRPKELYKDEPTVTIRFKIEK